MVNSPTEKFLAEYQAVISVGGYFPLQSWTTIWVEGEDRGRFLQNMCTNEILKLNVGHGCEAFFVDVKGKIIAHAFVMVEPDAIVLFTVPHQAEAIIGHLDRYVIREDVRLQDVSDQMAWAAVLGPQASQVIGSLAEKAEPFERGWQNVSFSTGEVEGAIVQFDAVWPKGFLVRCRHTDMQTLLDLFSNTGAKQISESVWTALRVESGLPQLGVDFDGSNLPQEVDRNAQTISFTKGCYLGQETIARIDALGHVNRQMVGVQIAGETIPPPGTSVFEGEKEVGTISSASWSVRLGSPLGLAMVRRGANEMGKQLCCELGDVTVVAFAED